eukprot:TRINITY_DN111800_c0_g1_i1.p1 TRINITY_DN111800_c0_g1~~TRINITY_DN111800_c0_g1_i1.p1  ORF type:complete len:146 (+),score=22.68 TRINITY_DN111800_c0_g1_i1:52-489(+)
MGGVNGCMQGSGKCNFQVDKGSEFKVEVEDCEDNSQAVEIQTFGLSAASAPSWVSKGAHYHVRLQRMAGATSLGFAVDHHPDNASLPIAEITGGLAAQWNNSHPRECQILVGDVVVEVNGMRGNPTSMLERLKNDMTLQLVLVRS